MKKTVFVVLFCLVSTGIFCLDNDLPDLLFEVNAGYAFGVNMDNAVHFDTRLWYPYERFGLTVGIGGLFSQGYSAFHFFVGPMMYIINNKTWRVPLALGFDIISNDTSYLGSGVVLSAHRRLTDCIYVGFNLEFTYAFNHRYAELTGYRTTEIKFDDGTTKTQTTPIVENKNHYGNNFYFKPSVLFGLQF